MSDDIIWKNPAAQQDKATDYKTIVIKEALKKGFGAIEQRNAGDFKVPLPSFDLKKSSFNMKNCTKGTKIVKLENKKSFLTPPSIETSQKTNGHSLEMLHAGRNKSGFIAGQTKNTTASNKNHTLQSNPDITSIKNNSSDPKRSLKTLKLKSKVSYSIL